MRICEKCGREIEDWGICPCSQQNEFYYSQNEFSGGNQNINPAPEPFVIDNFSTSKPKSKNMFPAVFLIFLAIAAFICYQIFRDDGYKKPIERYCYILETREDDAKTLFTQLYQKEISDVMVGTMDAFSTNAQMLQSINSSMDSLKLTYAGLVVECGSDYEVSYRIKKKEKMSQSDLDNYLSGMNQFYQLVIDPTAKILKSTDQSTLSLSLGLPADKIGTLQKIYQDAENDFNNLEVEKGYTITVELKIKGSNSSKKGNLVVNVVKVNGEWTFDFFSGNNNAFNISDVLE